MTDYQESVLSMYLIFDGYIGKYKSITDPLPKFIENQTVFKNSIPLIQAISELQKGSNEGYTKNKSLLRKDLTAITLDNSKKLTAFARFTGNLILEEKVNFGSTTLNNATDTGIRDYAQLTYDLSEENIEALPTYGITPESQTLFLVKIAAYNLAIGTPGISRAETKKLTFRLKEIFSTCNNALYNMDTAVEIVKLSQPEFYVGYKSARKVILTQSGAIILKGLVTDLNTGKPLKGANVAFVPNNEQVKTLDASTIKPVLVKTTANKGGYSVKKLPAGVYTVMVTKEGYADQLATLTISESQKSVLNIQLLKK